MHPGEAAGGRDYAERLLIKFNKEIQNEHFGKGRDLSIEGNLVTFKKLETEEATTNCFSFLCDGKIQNAAWTDLHMKKLVSHLKEELSKLKRLYETTDGCSKQYRCGTALWFLSALSYECNIIIDRSFCAPGHGKYG